MKLGPADVRGILGILPTPATPDADRWSATDTVNLPETEKMVRSIVGAGVDILMTTGTFGECATLTWPELRDFVTCVIETADGACPVFAGVTTLNTRDTVERGRALLDAGATGLFIGRPMWLSLDDHGILSFYRDIAEAFPGTPIVLYDNPSAFKRPIGTDLYAELAKIPELVAGKHSGSNAIGADMAAAGEAMRILPTTATWYPLARSRPELALASWSGAVACAPTPAVALSRAILSRDWATAEALSERLRWAEEPMFPGGSLQAFLEYSIQLGHIRFQAAGLVDVGPTRPPYTDVPDEYRAGSEECGRRWAQLEAEMAAATTAGGRAS